MEAMEIGTRTINACSHFCIVEDLEIVDGSEWT